MIRINIAPASQIFGMLRMFQILGGDTRPSFYVVRSQEEAPAILPAGDLRFEPLADE